MHADSTQEIPPDFSFNPFDEATRRDPFPLYARARREQPVYAHTEFPIVSVFRYADIQAILKDPVTWSNKFPPPPGIDPTMFPEPSMLGQDPPQHTRLRGLVNQAFTPRIIRRLESRMHEIANELLDRALEQGEVDLIQALTYPLPVTVIAEIIGVPAEDREQFKQWSDAAVENLGNLLFVPPAPEQMVEFRRRFDQMRGYFITLAEERRRQPREDLLTGLVQAEVEGSKLTHEEMLQMLVLLLVAGNETTTTLIGNAALTLIEHPEALARLRAEPDLLPSAIEEVLRYSSPVQMDPRVATRRVELHGHTIEPGRFVVSWLGSANRDEEMFANGERFDIAREENRHLAFGFGTHYCLGANLARLEAQVAIGTLLKRTRSFERTTSELLPLHPSIVFRAVTKLPLRLYP
ncbi:MAG: cytochrome P450 [Deltaproteobacteria bacterium]|nr:cytochrome P450 [Deltaproteobacteria bacterium]MBI3390561.1 cytochrome P450 [Deltaproteobacteria bacterium]